MAKLMIKKDMKEYQPGKFGQFSNKGFALAAQKLNKNGLMMWLYLCNNKDGYSLELSPTAISNMLGVTIDVAKSMSGPRKGLAELESAGFIKDGIFYAEGVPIVEDKSEKPEEKILTFDF